MNSVQLVRIVCSALADFDLSRASLFVLSPGQLAGLLERAEKANTSDEAFKDSEL